MILNTPHGYATAVVRTMARGTNVVPTWDRRITTPLVTRGLVESVVQQMYLSANLVTMGIYVPAGGVRE